MDSQTPFLTICMYLNEVEEEDRQYLADIIEEVLKQRIQGMQDRYGNWVAPAFPKLIYMLQEDNIHKTDKWYYLTRLAAECNVNRCAPDYISEKVMKRIHGYVYPSMGCVNKHEVVTYKYKDIVYTESFARFWNRMSSLFVIKIQPNNIDEYIDLEEVSIYDSSRCDFVTCYRIIKNTDKHNWVRVKTSNGRLLTCTLDHPLTTSDGVRKYVKDLVIGDKIKGTWDTYQGNTHLDSDLCWYLGLILCDGGFRSNTNFAVSLALDSENDIIDRLCNTIKARGLEPAVVELHRGAKGNYKDVTLVASKDTLEKRRTEVQYLTNAFEGVAKINRKIPSFIFNADVESRRHFLGGIIDADGYIHAMKQYTQVEIGSTNKELAIEQLLLVNSLGLRGKIIENRYNKKDPTKIRYQVSFLCKEWVLNYITCQKKKDKYVAHKENKKSDEFIISEITSIATTNEFSYDVTTKSDFFDVSGINSNNCRSFLSPWYDSNGNVQFYGRWTITV